MRSWKFIVAASAAMTVVSSCGTEPAEHNDLTRFGLMCPVREIVVRSASPLDFNSNYDAEFNRRGQCTLLRYTDPEGNMECGERYVYSKDGTTATMTAFDKNNEDSGRFEYEFDGRFIRKYTVYNLNSQEVQRWENENDGKHIVETRFYQECDLENVTRNTFTGDDFVQVLLDSGLDTIAVGRGRMNHAGKLLYGKSEGLDISLEYDVRNLPVSSYNTLVDTKENLFWHEKVDGTTARYEYEYDHKGNWIRRATFFGQESEPGEIITRKIRYY